MSDVRVLHPGDEAALDAFLATHAETSMFLRANARSAGLTDRGKPMQATYVAALDAGRITGVAAHCWNGMVLVQAPSQAAAV
ncbi:MAG TPA: GNAT family N-acetyltransferase, partial [bacterium]|nr:GNAT family N-acetyltransferase [bacterium]